MTKADPTHDELLSDAQLVLRDGYHDHLSRAVADARNSLKGGPSTKATAILLAEIRSQLERREQMYASAGGNANTMQGDLTCYLPYDMLRRAFGPFRARVTPRSRRRRK